MSRYALASAFAAMLLLVLQANSAMAACSVDVSGLDVEGNLVTANIRNTGSSTSSITYHLWMEIEGQESPFSSDTVSIRQDETYIVEYRYSFRHGSYKIGINATSDCGAYDSEIMGHIVLEGNAPTENQANPPIYTPPEPPRSGCGVKIRTFDYLSSITSGASPYAAASAENTGNYTETITLEMRLDNAIKGSYSGVVYEGGSISKTFYYQTPSAPGSYSIKLSASADCGSTDSATATLNVFESGGAVVEPPAIIEPPQPALQTSVNFYPTALDITRYRSKVIILDIDSSKPQDFRINVSGAPQDWLEFERSVFVPREKSTYIYVTPKESGVRDLTVSVKPVDENLSFANKVTIYVVPSASEKAEGTLLGYVMNRINDAINFLSRNVLLLVAVIIIVLIIVIALGQRSLKTDFEGLMPG